MPDTHGFDVVAEMRPSLIKLMLQAAWDSGGATGSPGTIPHSYDIAPGTTFGGFTLLDGQVQIPREGLDAALAPDVNGADLKFGLDIQVHVDQPPVPSASMIAMTADLHVRVPIGPTGVGIDLGILFGSITQANVIATLTSPLPDPITPHIDDWIIEYVHQMYHDGSIPATTNQTGLDWSGLYTVDATADVYDDMSDPARTIQVSRPNPGHVRITLPVHLRVFNIHRNNNYLPSLSDPMGVLAKVNIDAPLTIDSAAGQVTVDLAAATVTTTNLVPAPTPQYPHEGANYTYNDAHVPGGLASILTAQLTSQTTTQVQALGTRQFSFPTVTQINNAIASSAFNQFQARGSVPVWTPDAAVVSVTDVHSRATTDALIIALNAGGGADIAAITNFIPASDGFAVAMNGAKVLQMIDAAIHSPEPAGFGAGFPPHTFHNVNGHDVKLTRLDVSLTSAIHLNGDVTVVNAILGSIDVDASFDDDVDLSWVDNADGSQKLDSHARDPDVHLSAAAWILSLLFGFITGGIIGVIIAVVVLKVVENTAQSLGGAMLRDASNNLVGISAFPQHMRGIGSVASRFENPVIVEPDGLLFKG
jgi:hypothetical protein